MAAKKEYIQKAITTSIKFTSRCSMQIDGKYYTFEACEERIIPDGQDVDLQKERILLWDTVNEEVDNQAEETFETYGLRKEAVRRK